MCGMLFAIGSVQEVSMSEAENANAPEEGAEKPKSKMKLIILVLILLLVLGGAGGGGYYFFMRGSADEGDGEERAETSKKKKKKKKKKDDEEDSDDSDDSEDDDADEEDDSDDSDDFGDSIPDDEDVKQVIEINPFVVNLADGGEAHYLRITVSLGVSEVAKEEKPNKLYLARVKNAMLSVLSSKTSAEVLSAEGKSELRKQLLKAAQAAAEEPEVHAIYITDFIVQL